MTRLRSRIGRLAALLLAAACLSPIAGVAATAPGTGNAGLDALLDEAHKSAGAEDFLPPEKAFRLSATAGSDGVRLDWLIAPGYYLYRDRIKIMDDSGRIGTPQFPAGQVKSDEYFGKQVVYHNELIATVPLLHAPAARSPLTLRVTYQGCAEAGLCYPPITRSLTIGSPPAAANPPGTSGGTARAVPTGAATAGQAAATAGQAAAPTGYVS